MERGLMAFCAVCTATIVGAPFREPIGPDDAMVDVCKRCATEEVVPKEHVTPHEMRDTQSATDRAARIKAHREDLFARGLCKNGEKHGPHLPNRTVCAACDARQKRSESQRTRRSYGRPLDDPAAH